MRQIILDTETTGLETKDGHRIIEVGCVELLNRRLTGKHLHHYVNPDRQIDAGAMAVHGISNESLINKPRFPEVVNEFLDYIRGAELVIHNAAFDIGFLNYELKLIDAALGCIEDYCPSVIDTLTLARQRHPGQKNNLDALCKRYEIDNSHRDLHGALLDAEILALVYLAMTGGQTSLFGGEQQTVAQQVLQAQQQVRERTVKTHLRVIMALPQEEQAHLERLTAIAKASEIGCVWSQLEAEAE